MNVQTNVGAVASKTKPSVNGSDLSRPFLRDVFGENEDFSKGVIKDITPEIAKKLLEKNLVNRKIRDGHVDWLASQMKAGYWRFTGDSIKFNRDGILVDKQHTLTAIVRSGTTQRFVIIGGLDDEIIDVIDTGIARTSGDVLGMNGIQNGNAVAGICRRILNFKQKNSAASFSNAVPGRLVREDGFISNHRILEEVRSDPGYLIAHKNAVQFYTHSRMLSPSQYGLLYYIFSEKCPDTAWEFLSKFSNGIGLHSESPIYLLRQRLEKARDMKIRYSDNLQLYWFFTCWNKFRKGESMKILQTPNKIDIPELI